MNAPPDQDARDQIATVLDKNLFVEAGAGAGKTTSLVRRILSLVEAGVELNAIAAITFTEKAAAELRHRLRSELTEAAANNPLSGYMAALDQLDAAPIGTLHGFARRLLNEFPIAAGIPPGFGVLDEIESNIRFDDRWEAFLDEMLSTEGTDDELTGGTLLYDLCSFDKFGIVNKLASLPSGFERVARDFQANWDLVEERVDRDSPGKFHFDVSGLITQARSVAQTPCPPGDKQEDRCQLIGQVTTQIENAATLRQQLRSIDELGFRTAKVARVGAQKNWKDFDGDLDELRARQEDLSNTAVQALNEVRAYRKKLVGAILARWVLARADERRADGALEFHDLLVLARQLLAGNPAVRTALHNRYQRVLLDEFQDTDPIQLEIAVRLTAAPDDPQQSDDWRQLKPLPGRLFIVGDPKQSIYRFRRADIAQYLAAADQVGATEVSLTANFRSTQAVIDWVNTVFDNVIVEEPNIQPAYRGLDVARKGSRGHGSVNLIGNEYPTRSKNNPNGLTAPALRELEAQAVAATVATALANQWPVSSDDTTRPCSPGDICILLPARTSLPQLESALRAAGIVYRAENSSVAYVSTEIRHLMMALWAADDTTDELRLVAALRSPLYGCSDVDLYEWKQAGGRWSIWSSPPDGMKQHRVATALAHLASIARRATYAPPSELLAALVDERRVLDAALDDVDSRDVWRRVRFVIEQARAWSDAGGHGLRRYLRWAERQANESRGGDTVLPERDHDAVRIMTVHAAKGLEFPITILSGMTTQPQGNRGYNVVWPGASWGLTEEGDAQFDEHKPVDEQMSDAERRRLLYVAATRAVDHLVVSVFRTERGGRKGLTNAELLFDHGAADHIDVFQPEVETVERSPHGFSHLLEWNDFDEWKAERERAIGEARRLGSVSATTLAARAFNIVDLTRDAGLEKEPVDLDLPAWQRGRYGTAVGRAVHGVLQFCNLDTGADIDAQASSQCSAEGILGLDALVANLARSAIAAPIVKQAVAGPHHRELFVASSVDDIVFEGYIDLFVETPGGGIIVDYKTDKWFDDAERSERIGKYRLQLATYGLALEQILGRPPESAILIRCRPDGAAEQIQIADWHDALATARTAGLQTANGALAEAAM